MRGKSACQYDPATLVVRRAGHWQDTVGDTSVPLARRRCSAQLVSWAGWCCRPRGRWRWWSSWSPRTRGQPFAAWLISGSSTCPCTSSGRPLISSPPRCPPGGFHAILETLVILHHERDLAGVRSAGTLSSIVSRHETVCCVTFRWRPGKRSLAQRAAAASLLRRGRRARSHLRRTTTTSTAPRCSSRTWPGRPVRAVC